MTKLNIMLIFLGCQQNSLHVETTIEKDLLRLPERIAKRLRGERIEIAEIKEGILLKPAGNPIAEARGFLKGKRFTTQKYLELKMTEKELE